MTKKMLVACSDSGKILRRTNFVIPTFVNNSYKFISIPKNTNPLYGVVVYVGIEINDDLLFDKLVNSEIISDVDKKIHSKLFQEYLDLITERKIGEVVKFNISEEGDISFDKIN